jgi:phosphate transport system substrate-binding protein
MKLLACFIPRGWRGLAALAAGVALTWSDTAWAAEIKIGGTGNALGAMRLMGVAFEKQNPDVKVVVLPSLGTSGAIKAVPKGAIDIGLASRPLTDEEAKAGAVSVEYARSPLVFAVSVKTKANGLTLEQVADIYTGKLPTWPDGMQVRPILRQVGDDNTRQVRQMSPALERALSVAEQRPGMPFATNDQETADKLESIPGALGVTTLCLIMSEGRGLRPLAIDGVEPTAANGASGKYPHVKQLYYIARTEPSAEAKRFIAFIRSPAGREVLTRSGHWVP